MTGNPQELDMVKTLEELEEEARTSSTLYADYRYRGGKLRVGWWPDGNVYLIDGQRVTRDQAKEFLSCD